MGYRWCRESWHCPEFERLLTILQRSLAITGCVSGDDQVPPFTFVGF